jgi:probable rRNA maturation factor
MSTEENFTIVNLTKSKLPGLPFLSIKDAILGKKYDLSVSVVSARKQKELNRIYRGKDKTTNILSFPLSKDSGEITLDLVQAKKDAPEFNMPYAQFIKYLFIHGLLHLKGYEHSSTMEKEEKKYLAIFS